MKKLEFLSPFLALPSPLLPCHGISVSAYRYTNNRRITLTLEFAHGHVEIVGRRHAVVLARAAPGLVFDAQEIWWAVHTAAGLVHELGDGGHEVARVKRWHISDKWARVNANVCSCTYVNETYVVSRRRGSFNETVTLVGTRRVTKSAADDCVGTTVLARRRRRVECLC